MKLLILVISIFILSSCSNDYPASRVPSMVQNAVAAKFPGAIDIDWGKNSNDYKAGFDLNGSEYTVYVDTLGRLVSYKYDIKAAEIPGAIIAILNTDYSSYKIDDAEIVEKDNIIYYQTELESKQKKDLELVFLADGKLATQINYLK